jgi:hypothetical protein
MKPADVAAASVRTRTSLAYSALESRLLERNEREGLSIESEPASESLPCAILARV